MKFNEIEGKLKNKSILFAMGYTEAGISDQFQRWYPVVKEMFGKTILYNLFERRDNLGLKGMRSKFFEIIKNEKPDFVWISVDSEVITVDDIVKINYISPNTKTLILFGDDDVRFENVSRYLAKFIDYCWIVQEDYLELYKKDKLENIFLSAVAVYPAMNKPLNIEKKYDVGFVGTYIEPRAEVIRYLINKGVKVDIWGSNWDKHPEFKDSFHGVAKPEELNKIINQTKISLGLTKNISGVPHFKGRIFDVAACKGFSLVEYYAGYLKYFKNTKEIVMFRDNQELLGKISYYLQNGKERERIAEAAYKKTISNYTIQAAMKNFFHKILNEEGKFTRKQLNTDKKILRISLDDLKTKEKFSRIEDYDYVTFYDKWTRSSQYKDYLQIYSMEKTKREISCCDSFIYNESLGNIAILESEKACKNIGFANFAKMCNLSQLMVSKNYFKENLAKFRRKAFEENIDIINNENTCFVSIPLVSIEDDLSKFSYGELEKSLQILFRTNLLSLLKRKKILTNSYGYRLLFYSLIKNRFIIQYLWKSITDKSNWKKLAERI